jgi:pimeloyl-[acyl-carrier protein] methyl ester esterase
MNCTLVLLPGMDGTGEQFFPLTRVLDGEIPTKIVRYPDVPLDYREHEAFVREQLPRDGAFVVLGESFSGPIAISLAADPPPGMKGYVLCVSFVTCPSVALRIFRPLVALTAPNRVPAFIAQYTLMDGRGSKELEEAYRKALREVSNSTLRARLKAISCVDVRERLKTVGMPGLYMRGTRDRVVRASAARIFMQTAPNAQIVHIEGPHHLVQINPTDSAQALRTFIAKVLEAPSR